MDQRSRRLVLKRSPAEDEVQRYADELGWPRIVEEVEDLSIGQSREIAWAADSAVSLHYVEDPITSNSYVWFWGFDQATVDVSARRAENRLPVWRMDDLLRAVTDANGSADRATAVLRAGLGAPEDHEDRFFARISEAITDPDTTIREAGIYATIFSPYRGYRPLLEYVARCDPEPRLRDDAQAFLESFDSVDESPVTVALELDSGPVEITYKGYERWR